MVNNAAEIARRLHVNSDMNMGCKMSEKSCSTLQSVSGDEFKFLNENYNCTKFQVSAAAES